MLPDRLSSLTAKAWTAMYFSRLSTSMYVSSSVPSAMFRSAVTTRLWSDLEALVTSPSQMVS